MHRFWPSISLLCYIGVAYPLNQMNTMIVLLRQVRYWDSRHDDGEALTLFKVFKASACTVTVDPLLDFNGTIRCLSVPGFGLADTWQVTVSNLLGVIYRQPNSSQLSYARPSISTFDGPGAFDALSVGNQTVRILGTQFGTVEDDAVSLVTYGAGDKYTARDCHVVISHQVIECASAPGVGAQLRWSVSIGNLSSQTPTTSYHPPAIDSISGPGASLANTEGGQLLLLNGTNFGTVAESLVDSVTYWSDNNPSLVLSAVNCTVIVDHATVLCLTAPGIGYDLSWVVSIGGQASPRSTVLTSYGPPNVTSVSLASENATQTALLDTEGGTLLQVAGYNFGRAGDAVINFATKQSTSLVYVSHRELQVMMRKYLPLQWPRCHLCTSCLSAHCPVDSMIVAHVRFFLRIVHTCFVTCLLPPSARCSSRPWLALVSPTCCS